jgi:hypothetical protein
MLFWASTETHEPAYAMVRAVRIVVEPYLNKAFDQTSLADFKVKLRYVPIVMPKDMHARYSERSRARKKENIYLCAPHLDYDLFVRGDLDECLREYLRGIALSAPHLAKFGATAQQIQDFEKILAEAADRIMMKVRGQQLH